MRKLYRVEFMYGQRTAYTVARSIPEAHKKIETVLKNNSVYNKDECRIKEVTEMADETWPGVFGGLTP